MSDRNAIKVREFVGRQPETDDALAGLSEVSRAALRQFSLERTMAYGVNDSDAVELRGRVVTGEDWRHVATDLAETCLARSEGSLPPTRFSYLRRASALLRMSQMMMLSDTDERRATFARAADVYGQAAAMAGGPERVTLTTPGGVLAGWWLTGAPAPRDSVVGAVIVIGGVEGWAMDFDVMGFALSARGLAVLLLDGPGQGETRFAHHHYLTADWAHAFERAIDYVAERAPRRPIGIVGNSMGGGVAMAIAARDERIRACCSNGGLVYPGLVPAGVGTFFTKMVTCCGTDDPDTSTAVWSTVDPSAPGPNPGYPLLVVHGGKDPMISDDLARLLLDRAPTDDKEMVVFSDGDHCIYNHRQDRDILIGDWMHARLAAARDA